MKEEFVYLSENRGRFPSGGGLLSREQRLCMRFDI